MLALTTAMTIIFNSQFPACNCVLLTWLSVRSSCHTALEELVEQC